MTSFELPVLLRFSSREGSIRPYALAGPTAGYLLRARIQGGDDEGKAVDSDAKKSRTILVMAGVTFPIGRR